MVSSDGDAFVPGEPERGLGTRIHELFADLDLEPLEVPERSARPRHVGFGPDPEASNEADADA
jgi:hypothetical protein